MYARFVALAAGALLLSGCTSAPWLHPVIAEDRAAFEDRLAGVWENKDADRIVVCPSPRGGVTYSIAYIEKGGGATVFEGTLAKVGGVLLMDVTPRQTGVLQVPVHALVRIWLDGDQLRWTYADSEWMKDQIAARGLPTQGIGDDYLVVAQSSAVGTQILTAATDDRAYRDIEEMRRVR